MNPIWRFPVPAIIVIFFVIFFLLQCLLSLPAIISAYSIFHTVSRDTIVGNTTLAITNPIVTMFAAISAIATAGAVMITHHIARSPFIADLGFHKPPGWQRHTLGGLILGPIVFAVVLGIQVLAGWTTVEPGNIRLFGFFVAATGFAFVALSEELLCRGFLLTVLQKRYGTLPAVIGSSVLFGVLHATNPNATPVAIVMVILAGFLFAVARLRSGALWLPIALHWSWNVAEGPLFGFPVSGTVSDGIFMLTTSGPDLITGGAFGPEAGLVGLIGLGVALAGVLAVTHRHRIPA